MPHIPHSQYLFVALLDIFNCSILNVLTISKKKCLIGGTLFRIWSIWTYLHLFFSKLEVGGWFFVWHLCAKELGFFAAVTRFLRLYFSSVFKPNSVKIFRLCFCDIWLLTMAFFSSIGTVGVIFCHHMRVGFCPWATELARMMWKIPQLGIGIVWWATFISFPVFQISLSGRSWNSYGTSPNLWVQKKLVKFRQGTQDTWLCLAKFLREFLGYSPLSLLGDLGDVILG